MAPRNPTYAPLHWKQATLVEAASRSHQSIRGVTFCPNIPKQPSRRTRRFFQEPFREHSPNDFVIDVAFGMEIPFLRAAHPEPPDFFIKVRSVAAIGHTITAIPCNYLGFDVKALRSLSCWS